jgi:phage-related protein
MKKLGDSTGFGKLGSAIGKVGKAAGLGIAAVGAAGVAWAVDTAKALANVERIGAQTDAVLKSTQGAAGRTRDQIDTLAGSIEKLTGLEAETVTEGQNLLLTFTNIKGANFDSATQTMTDMAVALNGGSLAGIDMSATATQLGKALNDPIKGVTALSKVGVTFTDQQREQIKAMVEAGDTAGAQTLILAELQKEFGGSAEAAGKTVQGTWARIKNAFGEVSETVLAGLLPAMQNLADFVLTKGVPAFKSMTDWVSTNVLPRLREFGAWFKDEGLPRLREFGTFITGTAVPALRSFGQWVRDNSAWLAPLASAVTGAVVAILAIQKVIAVIAAVKAAMAAFKAAWLALNATFVMSPIGLLIVGITALVAALAWFFTQTETGKNIVSAAWKGIQTAVAAVVDWFNNTVKPVLETVWSAILTAAQSVADWYQTNVAPVFTAFGELMRAIFDRIGIVVSWLWNTIFKPYLGLIMTGWQVLWAGVQAVWAKIGPPIMTAIGVAIRTVQTVWNGIWNAIKTVFTGVWNAIKITVETVLGVIKGVINTATNIIKGNWSGAWNSIRDTLNTVWTGITRGVQNGIDTVKGLIGGIKDTVTGALSGAGEWLVQIGKNILTGLWNGINDKISWVTDKIAGLGTSVIDAAKGIFGIHSPSRVFRGIGGNLMDGLALGLKDTSGVKAAIRTATGVVTDGFNPTLRLSGGGLAAASASGGNTYNITVQTGVGDPVAIGREVSGFIKEFERVNGVRP